VKEKIGSDPAVDVAVAIARIRGWLSDCRPGAVKHGDRIEELLRAASGQADHVARPDADSLSAEAGMKENLDKLISLKQAAGIAGVSRISIWRWIRGGTLKHVEVGGKLFVRRADLDRALRARRGGHRA